jgi:hypothetical protein
VAGIEIPYDQWKEVIGMLLGGAASAAVPLGPKHAMLLTLGYICEDLVRAQCRSVCCG